jgi:hypothetical protein
LNIGRQARELVLGHDSDLMAFGGKELGHGKERLLLSRVLRRYDD